MTRSVALVVNPTAGRGRAGQALPLVRDRLTAGGCVVEVLIGADAVAAGRLVSAAVAAGTSAVITLGGDGLVHLAAQSVAETAVPLGVIPAGTGNDVARAIGLPLPRRFEDRLAAAVDVVVAGHIDVIDAARCEAAAGSRAGGGGGGDPGRYFLAVLASGFDSRVNERANAMGGSWVGRRLARGRLRYDLATMAELGALRPIPYVVTVDGDRRELAATLVAVGNGPSYGGGLRITPGADLRDGLLDVTVIGPVSRRTLVRVFPRLYSGTFVDHAAVTRLRGRVVVLEAPGVVAYADGERLGPLSLTVRAVPGAVRVFAPSPHGSARPPTVKA